MVALKLAFPALAAPAFRRSRNAVVALKRDDFEAGRPRDELKQERRGGIETLAQADRDERVGGRSRNAVVALKLAKASGLLLVKM